MLLLCCGPRGVQLLHPGNHPIPLSLNKIKPHYEPVSYFVVYSADRTYIAIAQEWNSNVIVLDLLSDTPQQSLNTNIRIQDTKVVNNTIFAVGEHQLIGWDLKAGARGVAASETLAICHDAKYLTLSHDCSQIAFARDKTLFLYDVKSQKNICNNMDQFIHGIQFSPDGSKLILDAGHYFNRLEIVWDWSSREVAGVNVNNWKPSFNPPSLHGYHIGIGSSWVENSRGSKLFWLPPNWRIRHPQDKRWDSEFLVLFNHLPQPIIIKFQVPTIAPITI